MRGLLQHTLLTLRLNGRNRLALAYGYLVPILFLFAFAALYRQDPRLLRQMGQLLTIGILGGCCFGLPTALVAERERGVWRRYRLLPGSTAGLVGSTMVARYAIVVSSAALQIAVAWLAFRTPLPVRPASLVVAFTAVAFAFEGMGLTIAALADTVPAVQALGQAVFLPVIIIGGVGVPLAALPGWARTVAAFLPGRYAVDVLQPCVNGSGLTGHGFDVVALLLIGVAGTVTGGLLFRWDANQPVPPGRRWAALGAVSAWAVVGTAAVVTGHHRPPGVAPVVVAATRPAAPWDAVSDADEDAVQVSGLPRDDDRITPVGAPGDSPVPEEREWMATFRTRLDAWPPAHDGDELARARAILSAAAIADVSLFDGSLEPRIARAVFDRLQGDFDEPDLRRLLTYLIRHPDEGQVRTAAPELNLPGPVDEQTVRERSAIYARKLLGRLLHKLPDVGPTVG